MTTETFTATSFDQAFDLCRLCDELGIWFENEDMQVRVLDRELTDEVRQAIAKIMAPASVPSNRTGLSGCGVHSFYVD